MYRKCGSGWCHTFTYFINANGFPLCTEYSLGSSHSQPYLWPPIFSLWCSISAHPTSVSEYPRLFPILKIQCYSARCPWMSYISLPRWSASFLCFRSQPRCCLFREVFPSYGIHLPMLLRKTASKPTYYLCLQVAFIWIGPHPTYLLLHPPNYCKIYCYIAQDHLSRDDVIRCGLGPPTSINSQDNSPWICSQANLIYAFLLDESRLCPAGKCN